MGRFGISIPAHGSISRVLQIRYRTMVVSPPLKVHRELCRDIACLSAVPFFRTLAKAPVQVDTLRCRHSLIDDLLVERMDEAVAASHRPIRPHLLAARPQRANELQLADQCLARIVDARPLEAAIADKVKPVAFPEESGRPVPGKVRQPDGPISAVTERGLIVRSISCSACFSPYQKL